MARNIPLDRQSLPYDRWPSSDQAAWQMATTKGDPFDPGGSASHWRPRTIETNRQHYGRWLGWYDYTIGLTNNAPASRAEPGHVRAYFEQLKSIVAPRTVLSLAVGLKVSLQAMDPKGQWRWLQDVCNRIQRQAKPSQDKRAHIRHSGEIVSAAIGYLASLPPKIDSRANALQFRNGLLLALAASRPLRVRNLALIEIGRNIVLEGDGWFLRFQPDETKTHTALNFSWPEYLVPWLQRYCSEIRPFLLAGRHEKSLWLNQFGQPMAQSAVYVAVVGLTLELLGTSINPHLLRDCAATMLADEGDGGINFAASLLGHRHRSTTERFYVHADRIAASRKVDAILEMIQEDLEQELGN